MFVMKGQHLISYLSHFAANSNYLKEKKLYMFSYKYFSISNEDYTNNKHRVVTDPMAEDSTE